MVRCACDGEEIVRCESGVEIAAFAAALGFDGACLGVDVDVAHV
jgi:hypothetical protein